MPPLGLSAASPNAPASLFGPTLQPISRGVLHAAADSPRLVAPEERVARVLPLGAKSPAVMCSLATRLPSLAYSSYVPLDILAATPTPPTPGEVLSQYLQVPDCLIA